MKQNKYLGKTNLIDTEFLIDKIVLNLAKKRKQVIYGARSIQAQNPLFARDTKDYDVYDKQPKQSAQTLKKLLNKQMGYNYYYAKPAEHKGTFKVKGLGVDNIKDTADDESIADYTKMVSNIPIVSINGIKYRKLKEEIKKKREVVKNPEFKFRHEKDKDDLNRIKGYLQVKKIMGGIMQ